MLVELKKRCALAAQAGSPEPCWGNTCAFWQEGGDDLEAGCAVERLNLDQHGRDIADFLVCLRSHTAPDLVEAGRPF